LTAPLWEDAGWRALPPLQDDVTADVCVVGLGGSGLAAVDELRTRGASVVGLDAGTVGRGAAGRNGGFLLGGLAHAYHEVVARLGREQARHLYALTLEELGRICATTPDAVRRVGSLRIEDDEEGLADCAAQQAALRADGFAVEDYEGPEGRGLHEGSPVTELRPARVVTAGGSVSCAAVVVAVDGRLDLLLPELSGAVRTVRLQMLGTAPTDEVRVPRPVYLRGGYEYWQQLPDGRLAVGGYRDVGGAAEETSSDEPAEPVQSAIEELLRTRLGVRAPVTHRWAASVGYTRTGLPYLGEVRDGVWAAGGYCGTGNVVGALCGRAAAARALGQEHPGTAFEGLTPA
jgi:glycine/D-amino acid oxidase-like deaminating enzyme